jgi:hypothetical protein
MSRRAAGSGRRAVVLLALALCAACGPDERVAHEGPMRDTLAQMRSALAKFKDDNGRYPHALDELVPRYLPRVPEDPVTKSATTWRLATEESVQPSSDFSTSTADAAKPQIIAVHSGAPGTDSTGKRWSDY